jgi:hypothetical protein
VTWGVGAGAAVLVLLGLAAVAFFVVRRRRAPISRQATAMSASSVDPDTLMKHGHDAVPNPTWSQIDLELGGQ